VVVVGEDFHFGHRRSGNVALLREMGAELGFDVEGLDLVGPDGQPAGDADRVSSTRIRHALAEGDLALANRLLGRPYEVRGVVARGDKRGRELGFPTANVSVPGDVLLPADGIYAGWYERPDGTVHPTAISLGRRPTFYAEAHASLLEAHLLDFSDDLYDEHAEVRFVAWLRGEAKFASVHDLVAQIDRDCDEARRLLERFDIDSSR
jgi:riboflavin kinase/FMN adenylyltransferase